MFERLFREAVEEGARRRGERVVAVVPHELHDGGADFGAWPEAARRHLPHGLHVVVKLRPHARKPARLRAGTRRQAVRDFRLHEDDHRLGRLRDALDELKENARAGLVGEVRDEEGEVVARAGLDRIKRVAREDRERGRVAEGFGEPRRENGVLLDGRDGRAAPQQLLGEDAEAGADLQDARARLREARRIDDRLQGVAVDEEVLPEDLVGVEAVRETPRLDLRWTREIHFSSGMG